ncbi:MAG: protein kinase [Proteobacteria bacterium]|nr:protein kinase [Pseudomonadota bacterium]
MLINPQHWAILSRLLDEALELPVEARERWLESLPPADRPYREELRTLLRHGPAGDTGDFLDILPNLKNAVDHARAAVNARPLRPGTAVGPYVIEREIGSGGMGAVWVARRRDGLIKRPVALKLPHPGPVGRNLAERFASERDILAELSHPNIARLYDAGFAEDGQPFLALEYVAGAPLIEYSDQQRLDVAQRLRLFQQVLRAVQYAHSNLVIHRDIKPSNVIVGNDRRAMLLDFGIAHLIAIEPRDDGGRALAGQAGGALTPDYASPEQIAGQPVTTASDIYSLGVLLFELLTGERPYSAAGLTRSQFEQAILSRPARSPSQALRESPMAQAAANARGCTARNLAAQLSGDLDVITLKALRKAPGERYATADALSADIECFLEGEPIAARRSNRWYRGRKFIARHKPAVVGAAAALLAIIATAAIATYEAHVAAGHALMAAAERDRALALSSRNEAIADFLNVLITESAGTERTLTSGEMLARSEAVVSAEFRGNTEQRTAVLDLVGVYYRTMGDEKRALRLLQEAFETIASSPDADLRRKVICDLGSTLGNLGNLADARRMLAQVIDDPQATPRQVAECLTYRSTVAQLESDPPGAIRYAREALERLRAAPSASAAMEAGILGAIADAERFSGHIAAAEDYFRQSLQQYSRSGREYGPDATLIRNNLALAYDATGNPKHALQLFNEILDSAARHQAGALPIAMVANRARTLELIGRFDEAKSGYDHCIELSVRGEQPIMRLLCLAGMAWLLRETGDIKAAEHYLREAGELARTATPAAGPHQTLLKIARGRIALANNQLSTARTCLDAALAEGNTVFFQMTALIPRSELNLREGQLVEAEADARKALSLAQSAQGGVPRSYRTGLAWFALGKVLAKRGDAAAARQAWLAAVDHLSNTVDPDHPLLLLARQLLQGWKVS